MNLKERLEALAQQATAWTTGTYEEQENNAHVVAAEARAIASELGRLAEEMETAEVRLDGSVHVRRANGNGWGAGSAKTAFWRFASALAPRKDRP